MSIDLATIKILRAQTGAGLMDVKSALEEAGGDIDKAKDIIKEKGKLIADKKSSRETREGWLGSYVHTTGKVGAMVELYCETDFVARNEAFQQLARDIALQITANAPQFAKPEDASEEFLAEAKARAEKNLEDDNKSDDIKVKILEGKIKKEVESVALYNQPFVKNPEQTIKDLISEAITKLGENIEVGKFVRFEF